jgi:CDP-6-deoxy-D-xylo-4-hexulose-3-dehydrase
MKKTIDDILQDLREYLKDNKPKYFYTGSNIPGESTILYSGPFWDENEIVAAVESLTTGKWLATGEKVFKFERQFAKKFGVKYAQMVNSGSSANLVMITALKKYFNWEDSSEIIVSPVGFPTTISPIVQNNLVPVFIDIEYDTLNFDLKLIEEKITAKTKAIFVSPVLGNPPDMDYLQELSKKHGILLIGDSCDSLGTKWDGNDLGKIYTAWSSSFYPAHHISTGEGGMVCSDNEELKSLFMSVASWGRDCYCIGSANMLACGTCNKRFDSWLPNYDGVIDHKYVFSNIGYNLKPLDLQGAIGIEQLKKFDEIDLNRKNSKKTIESILLKYVDGVKGVIMHEKSDTCWFGTPIICKDRIIKEKLISFLESHKIQTRHYFAGNILLHPGYESLGDYKLYPNANKVLDTVFFLGAAPHYNENVFDYYENIFKNVWVNE